MTSAGSAAAYLIEQARAHAGPKHRQGHWTADLGYRGDGGALSVLARERVYRVPRSAVAGLIAWDRGFPVELLDYVPRPAYVLAAQARGARCVSLLAESAPCQTPCGFAFAVHDLCHLCKFIAAYPEQVGFFSSLQQALTCPSWCRIEAELDDDWRRDRDAIAADTNGAAVFLLARLKMKLKMAARRHRARRLAVSPATRGTLDAQELEVFEWLVGALFDALDWPPTLRDAALRISTRRDAPDAAALLTRHYHEQGSSRLRDLGAEVWTFVPGAQ